MHLEPVEIQHVKLRRSLIGYDREAVDQLLENVTASYEDVWFERDKLEAELASLRNRLDGQAQAKEALEGTVKVAQHTADDLLAEARTKADAVVEDAHQRSLETMQEARVEHQLLRVEIKKLEVAETEITLRLRALLTAARELLDGHESIRELASRDTSDPPAEAGEEQSERLVASNGSPDPADVAHQAPASAPSEEPGADEIGSTSSELAPDPIGTLRKPDLPADSGARDHDSEPEPPSRAPGESVAPEPVVFEESAAPGVPAGGGDVVEPEVESDDPEVLHETPEQPSIAATTSEAGSDASAAAASAAALTASRAPESAADEPPPADDAAASAAEIDPEIDEESSDDDSSGDGERRRAPDPAVVSRALI